ncbi:type B 50S ribosomal protein L31, partial [Candidatus Falkowbacteria bacterium]|nr:type B 50S ribosomal protein L31 [Candidatus Falkowbacteria bacterium]
MKQDTHPQLNNVIFEDASTGARFVTTSVIESEKTETIDGVTYHIIQVEVTSDSHPFFTGKKMLVDSAGQVDKFKQ